MGRVFIGEYGRSVWLTYLGLASSAGAIWLALAARPAWAIVAVLVTVLCDLFDGRVARLVKRTTRHRRYGAQIDSLADMVSFGVVPVIILYSLGYQDWYHQVIYIIVTISGMIRLAYFNVLALESEQPRFHGLPILVNAYLLAPVYILSAPGALVAGLWALVALLQVTDIIMPKPRQNTSYVMITALTLLSILAVLVLGRVQ